jgi:hypothetical protein
VAPALLLVVFRPSVISAYVYFATIAMASGQLCTSSSLIYSNLPPRFASVDLR